jgi:hypothetical protein
MIAPRRTTPCHDEIDPTDNSRSPKFVTKVARNDEDKSGRNGRPEPKMLKRTSDSPVKALID